MFRTKVTPYHSCPMYEEHMGEFWQGCWEFTDICHMAELIHKFPEYNSFTALPTCTISCSVYKGNELFSIMNLVLARKKSLSSYDKINLLSTLKEIIKYFNKRGRYNYYE